MESYKLISRHKKPQQANQFQNVHLICTRLIEQINMYYTDLDSARKCEQDAKEIMKFCPELREGQEMSPRWPELQWDVLEKVCRHIAQHACTECLRHTLPISCPIFMVFALLGLYSHFLTI